MNYMPVDTKVEICQPPSQFLPIKPSYPSNCPPNFQPLNFQPCQNQERPPVLVMNGANPIRGMYTSVPTDICSSYGSSNIPISGYDMYGGSRWCQVGVAINETSNHSNNMMAFDAQFKGQNWGFRVRDAVTGLALNIDQIGNGPYGSFKTNDSIYVPGKGQYKIQIQTQDYLLYLPV